MPDVMTDRFARKYGRSGSCGDSLSEAITEFLTNPVTGRMDSDKFEDILRDNVINRKWDSLNNGQRRMMLGNVLRGMLRRGKVVAVGDKRFSNRDVDTLT